MQWIGVHFQIPILMIIASIYPALRTTSNSKDSQVQITCYFKSKTKRERLRISTGLQISESDWVTENQAPSAHFTHQHAQWFQKFQAKIEMVKQAFNRAHTSNGETVTASHVKQQLETEVEEIR